MKGLEKERYLTDFLITNLGYFLDRSQQLFGGVEGWQGKSGGYFCYADGATGISLLVTCIGNVADEKAGRCLRLCQEKALRLAYHNSHVSSWQSRNPDRDEWGGAIRVGGRIYSFSGLPELGDEALMLAVAYSLFGESMAAFDLVLKVALASQNHYWDELFHKVFPTNI